MSTERFLPDKKSKLAATIFGEELERSMVGRWVAKDERGDDDEQTMISKTVVFAVESFTIDTTDGVKLHTMLFTPRGGEEEEEDDEEEEEEEEMGVKKNEDIVVVLVHPYSVLGGCQILLRGIASGLARKGYKAVTFDMRGVGRSTGKPSLTGFREIKDVVSVCRWASQNCSSNRILLVGSSAGAPIAGSAVDLVDQVVGYVSIGYPFGFMASILFGRHHKAIIKSPKPKLFIMGTRDGFTSVKQLKNKLKSANGHVETHLIEGVSHFQMEGPSYDAEMVKLILRFIQSL
ncbi:OLC1v1005844C1 [Oldenlandia corymbosa var. corymbosa]|uniref:OLC1v1005844C1 n=1 Tax=Oldenlandia corymbosa var. corymbosa TaxID=529605 RepID=A0AAV1DHK8_OLDCO|nr:OLC1v1005844C1 [Oldenlandia corymbosa var. corymbosa]